MAHISETWQCSGTVVQTIRVPATIVWSVLRNFESPQRYKPFVKSSMIREEGNNGGIRPGCERQVELVSGLPATSSIERLDVLDDQNFIAGFSVVGGEHRLQNYRSITALREFMEAGRISTLVMESYSVDVPEGNSAEETKIFVETIIQCNLRSLASLCQRSRGNVVP